MNVSVAWCNPTRGQKVQSNVGILVMLRRNCLIRPEILRHTWLGWVPVTLLTEIVFVYLFVCSCWFTYLRAFVCLCLFVRLRLFACVCLFIYYPRCPFCIGKIGMLFVKLNNTCCSHRQLSAQKIDFVAFEWTFVVSVWRCFLRSPFKLKRWRMWGAYIMLVKPFRCPNRFVWSLIHFEICHSVWPPKLVA